MIRFLQKQSFKGLLLTLAMVLLNQFAWGQDSEPVLIAGWDFQTTTTGGTTVVTGSPFVVSKVYQANFGSGTIYLNGTNGSSNFATATNAETFSAAELSAGNGLGAVNIQGTNFVNSTTSNGSIAVGNATANGKHIIFKFSMTGYQDLEVSYATIKAGTGFTTQTWAYSTDGVAWTPAGVFTPNSNAGVRSLSTITDLNNVNEVYLRLTLTGASGNLLQTNRFDNIKFMAMPFEEPVEAVVWEDYAWSNGTGPTIEDDVIIAGDFCYVGLWPQESFSAKTLTIAPEGELVITHGSFIEVEGAIINNGTFTVQKGGNLVQVNGVANTGEIAVEVTAQTEWYGYNMFSSPVANQAFLDFSGNIVGSQGPEVYTYYYNNANDNGYDFAPGTQFQSGLGYLFAAPYSGFPQGQLTEFSGTFTGVPNNGNYTIPVTSDSYKALGNPYPSAIDAFTFLFVNQDYIGALYFWTNASYYEYDSENPESSDYTGNNYATYTLMGGVGTPGFPVPEDLTIEPGQGFLASITSGGNVSFANYMRLKSSYAFFYRTMQQEKHVLWLDLSNENNVLNQIAVGYMEGATEGFDTQIDGKMFGYSGSALYSIIADEADAYVIQGRELPFADTDVVPLGFKAVEAGNYTISLSNSKGIFVDEQDIYLRDNFTETVHDLKEADYTFISETGVFENRFEVVYRPSGDLGINNPQYDNKWIVYSKDNGLQIETQGFDLKQVMVYDLLGRLIYNEKAEGTDHVISDINNGVLILKVITADNQTLTKKTAK